MPQLQESGLKLSLEDLNTFMGGLKIANLGLAEMAKAITAVSKQAGATAAPMNQAGNATDGLGKAVGIATRGLTSASGSIGAIVSALGGPAGLVVGIGAAALAFMSIKRTIEAFTQAAQQALQSLVQFGQQGLMLAGRFNEMENSAIAVGRSYGIVDDATRAAIDTISDAGIRYDVAASSALQLIRNQIDLANATDLVAIAQATGIIIGADSSETMGRLTHAIATGNTAMLGYMGILVKKEDIDAAALETYGRTTDALSQQEKMQSRVNAIIKASVPIMGVYGSAMESPTKALRTLTQREIPTLGAVMMQTFIPAFKTGVESVRGLVKAITAAMDEGGSLYPILVNLGAAASLVADAFKAASDFVVKWIKNLQINVSDGAASTIEMMARWGVEMIAVFAQAIVQAAATYLTAAMRFVSSILTFWMAPGSPPRIAPEIDKWGAATITEWLYGMTKADFGILTSIQSTIGKFLSAGELKEASAQLLGFLSGEKGIEADFFKRLSKAAGFMGAEVSKLVKQQLMLANAVRVVEQAERRLEESRRAISDAQDETTALTKEYNKLLKEGAPPEVLDAKLAEINASEEQIVLAQEQIKEAEAIKREAEDIAGPLKEQIDLQQMIIAQMEQMAQLQEKATGGAAGAAGGIGGGAGAGLGIPELPIPDATGMGDEITNRITEAIEAAKVALRAKLAELFAPLREAWENVQDDLGQVSTAFNEFKTRAGNAWANTWDFVKEQYQKFIVFWEENGARFTKIAEAIFGKGGSGIGRILEANFQFAFGAAKDAISFGIDGILLVLEAFASTLTGDWKNLWNTNVKFFKRTITFIKGLFVRWLDAFLSIFGTNIEDFLAQWKENWEMAKTIVTTVITNILSWINEKVAGFITAWTTFWDSVRMTVSTKIAEIREAILEWIRNLLEKMGVDLDDMKKRWKKIFADIREIAVTIWKKIVAAVKKKVTELRKALAEKIEELKQWLTEQWETIRQKAETIWSTIVMAVTNKATEIRTKIQEIIGKLKRWWDETWAKFKAKVTEIWNGIKEGITGSEMFQTIKDALNTAFTNISTWLRNNIQRIKDIGIGIIEGLKEGVLSEVGKLIESVVGGIEDALAAAKSYLGIACPDPSPLFADLGIGIGEGLALGIRSMVPKIQSQMQLAVSPQAIGPVSMGAVAGGMSTSKTTNFNMGGVVIQDGMGMSEFQFRVERAILSST